MFNVKRSDVKKKKEILLCSPRVQQIKLNNRKVLDNNTVKPESSIETEKARFEIY